MTVCERACTRACLEFRFIRELQWILTFAPMHLPPRGEWGSDVSEDAFGSQGLWQIWEAAAMQASVTHAKCPPLCKPPPTWCHFSLFAVTLKLTRVFSTLRGKRVVFGEEWETRYCPDEPALLKHSLAWSSHLSSSTSSWLLAWSSHLNSATLAWCSHLNSAAKRPFADYRESPPTSISPSISIDVMLSMFRLGGEWTGPIFASAQTVQSSQVCLLF